MQVVARMFNECRVVYDMFLHDLILYLYSVVLGLIQTMFPPFSN